MRILTAKGLVESRPKAGTRVTPRRNWNLLDPEVLAWALSGAPDPAFLRNLFELRAIIEPAAAALAAERRSDDQAAAMVAALEVMRAKGLADPEGQAADREFHRLLLEATGNDTLISLAGSVGAAVHWTTQLKQRLTGIRRDPMPEHDAVCDAVASGDGAAARTAMLTLIELAQHDLPIT